MFFVSKAKGFPAPQCQCWVNRPTKIVPERTKVWRNRTRLAGKPNIEIGGRGELPFPTSPEDMAELSQQLRSVLFSKFCPPTEHGVAFLPLKTVPHWPPWALERPTAKKPQARRAPESFWTTAEAKVRKESFPGQRNPPPPRRLLRGTGPEGCQPPARQGRQPSQASQTQAGPAQPASPHFNHILIPHFNPC